MKVKVMNLDLGIMPPWCDLDPWPSNWGLTGEVQAWSICLWKMYTNVHNFIVFGIADGFIDNAVVYVAILWEMKAWTWMNSEFWAEVWLEKEYCS